MKPILEETILFLDFDGTLAEIRDTPDEVYLDQEQWMILENLSKKHSLFVLSGRSFHDIQKRVPRSLAGLSGDHGAIREFGKEVFIIPAGQTIKELLKTLSKEIFSLESEYPKMLVETKDFSLSIHYRNLPEEEVPDLYKKISAIKRRVDTTNILVEAKGKSVWEYRHPDARKEKAVSWFVEKIKEKEASLKKTRNVFIGDDLTDWNSIIWAGNSGGKGIWVGENFPYPIETYKPEKRISPKEIWKDLEMWSKDDTFIPFSD
ncbi:trehalose-phosphatase [Leptospirillum ferrooxidans]|jgi:trehalose 6-phosphate phosphatase|uniref:Trehalose 6-phosphate phosphatase n=1 Tax=Leptospirillum ferrooxidans (strain C2-3) TaxID=1162668 RepID=I0IMW9_LEPFC|nr:trehalose-phosphatase [Leptospirillum ferrooxidans]BAM06618.1 putative trehalose-6-phosphate phosphatase [Leptospirillum ferrooxidans C2-3]